MTSRVKQVVPPAFFTIPPGTEASECGACRATVYRIPAAAAGEKETLIDAQVMGGRAPTETKAGTGVLHFVYCSAPARQAGR